jgi:hypothetical protein
MSHEHAAQETIERGHAEVRSRRLGILIAVLLVLAIAADRWIFHRPTEQSMLALLGLIVVLLVVDRLFNRGIHAAAPPAAATTSYERDARNANANAMLSSQAAAVQNNPA